VASNIVGVSGRAMLEALIAGQRDPAVLADLAKLMTLIESAQSCSVKLLTGDGCSL